VVTVHGLGRLPFRRAGSVGNLDVHHQADSVFHQGMAHETELGLVALALLVEAGTGSVVEVWVALNRFSPLKWTVGLRVLSSGGGEEPSFFTKLFWDARAWIRVPSTEKCSSDSRSRHSANARTRSKNSRERVSFSNRSRLTLKVEQSHTAASIDNPTNQRNSRLKSICWTSCRSERMENKTCSQAGAQ
jgi:hypothetical protein